MKTCCKVCLLFQGWNEDCDGGHTLYIECACMWPGGCKEYKGESDKPGIYSETTVRAI